jgi:hypothetical protein
MVSCGVLYEESYRSVHAFSGTKGHADTAQKSRSSHKTAFIS